MPNFFKYSILIFSLFIFSKNIKATHIVGGDFKIDMVNNIGSGAYYNIQLRLYRDDVNGAVTLPSSVTVGVYQVGTNTQVTTKTIYLISSGLVPLGDPCYTPNPGQVRIEEGVYQNLSGSTVLLTNYSPGYYIQYETCCRNSLVNNLQTPTSLGISIFAKIPDPAIGQNSTPDFGAYPNDAYFCVNNIKQFTWPVTDPDGDSLVFSLVAPLDESGQSSFLSDSGPATGAYPTYPNCPFSFGYSASNMIGGTPNMTINSITGEITASPAIQGFFAYAVRVEEYRNGIKLGEVRRDAQYASLPCQVATSPEVTVNNDPGASNIIQIDAYVDDQICFDVEVSVLDPNDSIYLQISSSNFDLVNTYVSPTQSGSVMQYLNWQNVSGQTFSFSPPQLQASGYLGGKGKIGMRYCWEAPCSSLNEVLDLTLSSYTVSCAGILTVDKDLQVNVVNDPEPISLDVPSSISLTLDSVTCLDLYALDNKYISNPAYDDTLFLEPTSSSGFDFAGTYQVPDLHPNGSYFYEDFTYTDSLGVVQVVDSLFMDNFYHTNNISAAIGEVGLRFCWTVDCDYVFQQEFDLDFMAYSTVCASDTTFKTAHVEIDPPIANPQPIPNTFSPNGDNVNDYFQLTPFDINNPSNKYNDPCFDQMKVSIYNRWGQKVFESEDPNFKWDGTKNGEGNTSCKPGSYIVIINGTFGSTYDLSTGVRIPNPVKDEYFIQLFR